MKDKHGNGLDKLTKALIIACATAMTIVIIVLLGFFALLFGTHVLFPNYQLPLFIQDIVQAFGWDNDDIVNMLTVTIPLVIALCALCVTAHLSLISGLTKDFSKSKAAHKVVSHLQSKQRNSLVMILIATSTCILADFLWVIVIANASFSNAPAISSAGLFPLLLSVVLCMRMMRYCMSVAGSRDTKLLEISQGNFDSAMDTLASMLGYRIEHRDVLEISAQTSKWDIDDTRGTRKAIREIVANIDDDLLRHPPSMLHEWAYVEEIQNETWTALKEAFLRCEEAYAVYKAFAIFSNSSHSSKKRHHANNEGMEIDLDVLRERMWERVLASPSEIIRPLQYQRFHDLDLSGVCFSFAQSRGTRFSSCDLAGASFQDADLRYGEFSDCNLIGADLSGADCRFLAFRDCFIPRATLLCGVRSDLPDMNSPGMPDGESSSTREKRYTSVIFSMDTSVSFASFDGSVLANAELILPARAGSNKHNPGTSLNDKDPSKGFSFDGCSLQNVSFRNSVAKNLGMKQTTWAGSILNHSTLQDCDLSSSSMEHATMLEAEFRTCSMTGAKLHDAYAGDSRFERCELDWASLDRLVLADSSIDRCSVSHTSAEGLRIIKSNVKNTSFNYLKGDVARFVGTSLKACSFAYCSGTGWSFLDAKMRRCHFDGARIRDADFSRCVIKDCRFRAAELPRSSFAAAKIMQEHPCGSPLFEDCLLTNTSFVSATIEPGVRMDSCDVSEGRFVRATIRRAVFSQCCFAGAAFNHAEIHGCIFRGAEFSNITFDNAIIRYTNFVSIDKPDALVKKLKKAREVRGVFVNGKRIDQ